MNDRVQVLFAFLLLVVLAPLILGIAFFLPVFSGFPIFFRGQRLGRRKTRFKIAKFRSMVVTAEKIREKSRDDPRITWTIIMRNIIKSGILVIREHNVA